MKTCKYRSLGFSNRFFLTVVFLALACFLTGCEGSSGGGKDDDGGPFIGGEGTGAEGVVTFWRYLGDPTTNEFGINYAVDLAEDNGFFVAGLTGYFGIREQNYLIAKTDETGVVQWRRDGGEAFIESLHDIKKTPDGGAIAVGIEEKENRIRSALVVKIDSEGEVEWRNTFQSGMGNDHEAYSVCVLDNGNEYAIAGRTHARLGESVRPFFWFFKVDRNGSKIDESERFIVEDGGARSMDKTADGGFVLAGFTTRGETANLHVARLTANGNLVWEKTYGPGVAFSVRSAGQEGFIIVGSTRLQQGPDPDIANEADALAVFIDSDGDMKWKKFFGGSYMDVFNGVDITDSGEFIAAGITRSYSGAGMSGLPDWARDDIFLVKLDKRGNPLWQKVKGKKPNNSEVGCDIRLAPDGGFVVAGSGPNILAKFDKNGKTINLDDMDFTYTVVEDEGIINMLNAENVAIAAADAVIIPFTAGAMPTDLLIGALEGMTVPELCNRGGAFQWAPLPQTLPDLNGQSFLLSFSACESGSVADPVLYNGSIGLTVNSVAGDMTSQNYEVQITVDAITMVVSDDVGVTNFTGGMVYNRQSVAGNYSEQLTVGTNPFTITGDEGTLAVHELELSATRPLSGSFKIGAAGEQAVIETGLATGYLDIQLETPVTVNAMDVPVSGELQVTAQDGSNLTILFDNGFIDIHADINGDGEIDETMRIEWD